MILPDLTDYAALRERFRWRIPDRYNIAVDVCDRWAAVEPGRPAIIEVSTDWQVTPVSFGWLREHSNRLANALRARGVDVDFRATGQTGIMIAGSGMPIDAVVSDFIAGAAEMLSPAAPAGHVDVIEGQGSLMHPAYGAVSLGLLQGSQPDVFVVCHEPGRTQILGHPGHAVPSIEAVIEATVLMGRVTNPNIRCAGVSLNTGKLSPEAAQAEIEAVAARVGLPAADPLRGGPAFERLLDACLA